MSEQATISLTVGKISFQISGPEAFVTTQAQAFRDAIVAALARAASQPDEEEERPADAPPAAPHKQPTDQKKKFVNALHMEGDKVQILKPVPGNVKSKKAVNTALMYLWAKREMGIDEIPSQDVKEACRLQGCLDESNFAQTMKSATSWIVVSGTKGSPNFTLKLTMPGVQKAEELLQQLNGTESTSNP